MDLTGKILVGKYEIESLLGQGGMGAVWRARHSGTGRKLAIKVLDESYLGNSQVTRRFGREARAASAIAHPGIVEVLDIDEMEDGLPFIVMEFLEGETLARRIERRGRLGQDELVRLGVMLLEALEAAHAHGVIHRDLKPENIYVVPAGRRGETVKILDFGISHMREEHEHKLTMTGSVLGTPHYMSPEQAMGESTVDHRADLYAAGVVLYECAVGDVPFDAPNYNKLLRLILDREPPTPRERDAEISGEVETVILWAMDKLPEKRIPDARTMVEWLQRAAKGESPPYERVSPAASGAARPAVALPAAHVPPSLDDGMDLDVEVDVLDEEPAGWEVSPTLASAAQSASSRPPPSGAVELELDPEVSPRRRRVSTDEIELDLSALRSSRSSSGSIPAFPAVGASSSGNYPAVGAAPSPGGSPVSPSVAPAAAHRPSRSSSGQHHVPKRLSEVTGGYEAPEETPSRLPAWLKNGLFALLGIGVFVGLVFGIRAIVQPGVDPDVADRRPAPPVSPEEPVDVQPTWVSIRIVGLPPSARMLLDGLPASSPLRLRRGGRHVVEITADGYEDRRIEIPADRNRTINARLRPAVQDDPE